VSRYFFDVRDGKFMPDDTGTDLPTLQAARIQALRLAGQMLNEDPEKFLDGDEWQVELRDPDGLVLFTFAFVATDSPAAAKPRVRTGGNRPVVPQAF
jgi:hypothetical protein